MAAQFPEFSPAILAARRKGYLFAGDDKEAKRADLTKLRQDVDRAKARVAQETGMPFDNLA